jgi:Xylose isomerase-like TIM barrel
VSATASYLPTFLVLGAMHSKHFNRRHFIHGSLAATAVGLCPGIVDATEPREPKLRFGLVTYMWGHDWDLPTLLANCEKAGAEGVELRTTHGHGVEPSLNAAQRRNVKLRFGGSPVTLVGLGTNEDFHDVDPQPLRASIDAAKAFIQLSHDVGASGVKVKPNDLPPNVPEKRTIEQIGRSLNELGAFATDLGQQVRLEVHGGCARLPTIAAIMKVADHPSVAVCWNSNPQDLEGAGLEHNFRLVKKRLGRTTHVRQLQDPSYPYAKLVKLLKQSRYDGWLLAEESLMPADRVAALADQRKAFDRLCAM